MNKFWIILFLISIVSCKKAKEETSVKKEGVTKEETISTDEYVPEKEDYSKNTKPLTLETNQEGITNLPENISKFIPKGYTTINVTSGNLNLDDFSDTILVLKKNGEESNQNEDRRPILIVSGQPNKSFKLEKRNDNAVFCYACGGIGGDPFVGITIKNGYFSIEHGVAGGQHWDQITTFKYNKSKSNWFLYKDGFESYELGDNPDGNALVRTVNKQETVKDFGAISIDNYDIYKRAEEK